MSPPPSYTQLITRNLIESPVWGGYLRGEGELPNRPQTANLIATFLFYLGDIERAREVSHLYSRYSEDNYNKYPRELNKLYHLFRAALFRALSGRQQEAEELWGTLVDLRRTVGEAEILKSRRANVLIYEAYALAKLGRYREVPEPAQRGFQGIIKGKGITEAPHKNSLEYGLADVLDTLVSFRLDPKPMSQQKSQDALLAYKKENFRYGRLGYSVIFDLQMSYPDVLKPVLPGPVPNED
jgi:tetratricopeptide (TPR) repeat protein